LHLVSISVVGLGSDFTLFDKIIFNLGGSVSINGQVITNFPYTDNGVSVTNSFVRYPNGEYVSWDPNNQNVHVYLPGNNYWKNVKGLCGYMDASVPYCTGSYGERCGTSEVGLNFCGATWEVSSLKRNVPNMTAPAPASGNIPAPGINIPASGNIPAPASGNIPSPASGNIPAPGNIPSPASGNIPAPALGNIPAPASGNIPSPASGNIPSPASGNNSAPEIYNTSVVSFNLTSCPHTILTTATTNICNAIFGFLKDTCPPGTQQNLLMFTTTCIYDGTALVISAYMAISGGTPITSIESFFNDIENAEKIVSTVLSQSTFNMMVSSVISAAADCFFRNITNLNETSPNFDLESFTNSYLPTCEQYCSTIDGSCVNGVCQFDLTLSEIFAKYAVSGAPSIYLLNISLVLMMIIVLIFI